MWNCDKVKSLSIVDFSAKNGIILNRFQLNKNLLNQINLLFWVPPIEGWDMWNFFKFFWLLTSPSEDILQLVRISIAFSFEKIVRRNFFGFGSRKNYSDFNVGISAKYFDQISTLQRSFYLLHLSEPGKLIHRKQWYSTHEIIKKSGWGKS